MEAKNNNKAFVFLGISAGVLALSGLAYWYYKKKKADEVVPVPDALPPAKPIANNVQHSSLYPLKKGSKGELVKQLQNALISNYGAKISADGAFGEQTKQALIQNSLPEQVTASVFETILKGKKEVAATEPPVKETAATLNVKDVVLTATSIKKAIESRNTHSIATAIKTLQNTANYIAVNEVFKNLRTFGVRQTIVNAALSAVMDIGSKEFIKDAFKTIGLKYNDSSGKWSLSGLGRALKTKCSCMLRHKSGLRKRVPKNTYIGREIASLNGVTAFATYDNQVMYVPTNQIY